MGMIELVESVKLADWGLGRRVDTGRAGGKYHYCRNSTSSNIYYVFIWDASVGSSVHGCSIVHAIHVEWTVVRQRTLAGPSVTCVVGAGVSTQACSSVSRGRYPCPLRSRLVPTGKCKAPFCLAAHFFTRNKHDDPCMRGIDSGEISRPFLCLRVVSVSHARSDVISSIVDPASCTGVFSKDVVMLSLLSSSFAAMTVHIRSVRSRPVSVSYISPHVRVRRDNLWMAHAQIQSCTLPKEPRICGGGSHRKSAECILMQSFSSSSRPAFVVGVLV